VRIDPRSALGRGPALSMFRTAVDRAPGTRPASGASRPEWEGARGGGGEAVRFNSILVCAEPVAWGRVDASNSRYVDSAPTAITDFGLAVTRSSVRALPVAVQQTRHRRPRRISSALSHSGSCTRSTKRHRSPQLPHTTDLPSGWRRPVTVCLNSLTSDRCSVCWQALPPGGRVTLRRRRSSGWVVGVSMCDNTTGPVLGWQVPKVTPREPNTMAPGRDQPDLQRRRPDDQALVPWGPGSCRYQAPWAPRSSNPHIRDLTESGAGEARSHLNRNPKS
jgi:hypothetical protein